MPCLQPPASRPLILSRANRPRSKAFSPPRPPRASWPSAEIVAEILASGDPRLDTTSAIAGAICAAISRPAGVQTEFSAPPTVNDVAIRGERLPDGGGT
jgi:hypothetical protein